MERMASLVGESSSRSRGHGCVGEASVWLSVRRCNRQSSNHMGNGNGMVCVGIGLEEHPMDVSMVILDIHFQAIILPRAKRVDVSGHAKRCLPLFVLLAL